MYRTVRIRPRLICLSVGALLFSLLIGFGAMSSRNVQDSSQLIPSLETQEAETYPVDPSDTPSPKKAYLTFDDGPSGVTPRILDILNKLDIKATFFVIGRTSEADVATLKRIQAEGHSIGLHSYSHRYQQIYHSVSDYLSDFNAIEEWVFSVIGTRPCIFRFPGGSNNATANKKIMADIADEMTRRGYRYYDWNVIAHDDQKEVYPAEVLLQNVKKSAEGKLDRDLILLFHDNSTRKTTPEVLPQVVAYFREQGYSFDRITPETPPIQFYRPLSKK